MTERGQAIVEFALIIPIALLVMLGLFDLGRVVFINNSLSDGARHGARHASIDPRAGAYCATVDTAVRSAIRGQALTAYTVTYTTVAPNGASVDDYLLCAAGSNGPDFGTLPDSAEPGDLVTVALDSDVDLALGLVAQAVGTDSVGLHAESTMQVTFAPRD